MNSERDVKAAVKCVFAEANIRLVQAKQPGKLYWFMPPANGYGRTGIPDFMGTIDGLSFAIETKFGRGTLTAHQTREVESLVRAGAKVWIVRETTLDVFRNEFNALVELSCS